jgi:2-polyprenyl-6-methoxyphenol hydroxylase-like FAD-dependent oxidoreductase
MQPETLQMLTQRSDLLVGADGVRSFVRQQMLSEVKPRDAGYVAWRGVVPESEVDRTLLVGDAAFVPRPHTAASTSKAAANAIAIGETIRASSGDLVTALGKWESAQLTLGQRLEAQGRMLGNRSQFS